MINKKKIPVITEIIGGEYLSASSGAAVLPVSYVNGFTQIVKESASAVNFNIPESVKLLECEIIYGKNKIEDIRYIGYDAALLNDKKDNLHEATRHTPKKPNLDEINIVEEGKILIAEPNRYYFAFYVVKTEADAEEIPSVIISWNLPKTIDGYDKEIYEENRLTLFFQNSCTLLAAAGFLLENEDGLNFLENELGKFTINDLKKMLEPISPVAASPTSKIEITGEFENIIYNYQVERFTYDIGCQYFRTIKFDDNVVRDLATREKWSEARAKAVTCVKFAVAMDEYINVALQIYPNFTVSALQIFVKHLIGEGFWKHLLYSVETPAVDFTGKKSDVRDQQIESLFDALRLLLKAQKGRPKKSFKKIRRPDKSSAEAIKNAIIAICRTRGEFADETKITQNEIGEKLGVSARTVRNMVKSSGEDFDILRDGAIREYIGKID